MASAIEDWIRTDMTPLAKDLGSVISDLDNFDSYDCRGRNGVAGAPLSEHGRANALDVRALKLANGQSSRLPTPPPPRDFPGNGRLSPSPPLTTGWGPGPAGNPEDHTHLHLLDRH